MKDWKDIQDEIRKAEEPLSPQAWNQLEKQLNKGRKAGWFWFLGTLLLSIGILSLYADYWKADKDYYKPRVASNQEMEFSGEQSTSASWEIESGTNKFQNQTKNYKPPSTIAPKGVADELERKKSDRASAEVVSNNSVKSDPRVDALRQVPQPQNLQKENFELQQGQGEAESLLSLNYTVLPRLEQEKLLSELQIDSRTLKVYEAKSATQKATNLELRFFMAPTYNLPSLEYHNAEAQTHKEFQKAIDNAVKPGWGLDAGFELRYRIYKNLRISTGFTYREVVTQNNYDFEVNEIPVIDSASGNILAYISTNQPEQRMESSSNMYTFLNIPLSLYYEKPIGLKWTLTGEVINNISFLVNQSGYGINPTTLELKKSEESFFNKTTNSYQLRLGLRYKLTENFYLALEPAYRKSYQDFISDESVSWKPRDFSLSLTGIVILK